MEIFGYTFRRPELLENALTTPSFRMTTPGAADNQRLEFLGDAVLGLLAADSLYREFASSQEGELTERRTRMVSTAALCAAARRLGLATLLRRNKGAAPVRGDEHFLADAMEAILGAAWLDGGLEATKKIFAAYALGEHSLDGAWGANPKGELQKAALRFRPGCRPQYSLLSVEGSAHAPLHKVRVEIAGFGWADATAHSRHEAECAAAANLLKELANSID